jgi:hypothetical protein
VSVGRFQVEPLVDAEGSFATVSEVFPAVDSGERWWLPVIVSHFHGVGRFEHSGKGFRWAVE